MVSYQFSRCFCLTLGWNPEAIQLSPLTEGMQGLCSFLIPQFVISCSSHLLVIRIMSKPSLVLVTVLLYMLRILLRWARADSSSLVTFARGCNHTEGRWHSQLRIQVQGFETLLYPGVTLRCTSPCPAYLANKFCFQLSSSYFFSFRLDLLKTMGRWKVRALK